MGSSLVLFLVNDIESSVVGLEMASLMYVLDIAFMISRIERLERPNQGQQENCHLFSYVREQASD